MAYRPLKEPKDWWPTLTKKINDALDYLFGLASSNENKVKKSITVDTDGKAQLVNDLDDNELVPNLVYGVDESSQRGFLRIKNVLSFTTNNWVSSGNSYYITFTHNLNSEYVIVQVYDENKKQVIVEEVQIVDKNNVKITTTEKFDGFVIVWG